MTGVIYRLVNTINGKSYIGKTCQDPDERYKQHIRDIKRYPNRPLYRALTKYGVQAFEFQILGQYNENALEEAEIQAIKEYNTYTQGYNATKGGEGTRYSKATEEIVVPLYKSGMSSVKIADHLRVGADTVTKVLKEAGVTIKASKDYWKQPIAIVDPYEEFQSSEDCAKFLIECEISDVSVRSTMQSINRVLSGNRKTYKDLKFIKLDLS